MEREISESLRNPKPDYRISLFKSQFCEPVKKNQINSHQQKDLSSGEEKQQDSKEKKEQDSKDKEKKRELL